MSLKWKALIVVAVFAGGFGAAMFFRKDGALESPPSPEVLGQPVREIPKLVPVRMTAESGVSPAESLVPVASQKPDAIPADGPFLHPRGADLDAPPDIGSNYTPLADPFRSPADVRPTLPGDPSLVPVGATPRVAGPRLRQHVLRDGDTLAGLAQRYYGDPAKAKEIYAANRLELASPDVLPIGRKIVLPGIFATDD